MPLKSYREFPGFSVVAHPLISHKLSLMRDTQTSQKAFKELAHEITLLLGYEATHDLVTMPVLVNTPLETFLSPQLVDPYPVILPILRAGIGMVDALLALIPTAKVGHIGLYRDEETLQPQHYYFKIPDDCAAHRVFICDPMLATGHSAVAAVDALKSRGITSIFFICLLAAPEGVQYFLEHHPEVPIYAASLDRCLNEKGYILPGLGDAGDRLFGTK